MTNVLQFAPATRARPTLECVKCGARTDAACDCGVEYRLTPGERAAQAVATVPEKSDRAIAADIGVHKNTVQRARKATGPHGPVDAPRTGRDGKQRKLPASPPPAAGVKASGKLYQELMTFRATFEDHFAAWFAAYGSDPELREYLAQGLALAADTLRDLQRKCERRKRT